MLRLAKPACKTRLVRPGPLRMPAAPAAHGTCNLLTATPDEAALIIAAALNDPRHLLSLALACRRFATKCVER